MLSTDLTYFLLGFACFTSIGAAIYAVRSWFIARRAVDYAMQTLDWVQENNQKSLGLAKIADLESAMTELTDSYSSLLSSHKKLRSRIGMRELREKRANGAEPPESETYEAKKRRLREEAKQKGFLK